MKLCHSGRPPTSSCISSLSTRVFTMFSNSDGLFVIFENGSARRSLLSADASCVFNLEGNADTSSTSAVVISQIHTSQ